MTAPIALIAAVARNGIIGSEGRIPWRLPSDFAFFKRQTMGKPLIMGRATFDSIGKALAGRTNIVVTRNPDYAPDGTVVVGSLELALDVAQAAKPEEVMIAGGGLIYGQTMPLADRLYVTHVDLEPDGDVHFPEIDPEVWVEVEEIDVPRSGNDSAGFRTVRYERR